MGIEPIVKIERCEAQTRGGIIVVTEFHYRDLAGLVVLYIVIVDTEATFDILVSPF